MTAATPVPPRTDAAAASRYLRLRALNVVVAAFLLLAALSFTAKSLLAWLIFANVRRP